MFNVPIDGIQGNVLYGVYGDNSVLYNGVTYLTGQNFRGIQGIVDFEYVGSGSEAVYEVTEFYGGCVTFEQTIEDQQFPFEATGIEGMAIVLELNDEEKIVQEVTRLTGMSVTLEDFPYYANPIIERRL